MKHYPDLVSTIKLFDGVSKEERDLLLQSSRLRPLKKGEYLFRHGDPVEYFYIVCSGAFRLMRETPDGQEITTDMRCSGKTINKVEILNAFKLHSLSAYALEDATVLVFPASWLKQVAAHPVIALNIISSISHYAHMMEIESEQKSTMSVAQRLGCFLQRLCVVHDLDPAGFELPYSKSLIASRLGMKPETLSRTFATLKDHGIVVNDTKVSFRDAQAVEEFVCEHCSIVEECGTHQKFSKMMKK